MPSPSIARPVVVGLLVGALIATLGVPAVAQTAEERRLEEVRREIQAVREQIDAAQADREAADTELVDAESHVQSVVAAVTEAELAVQSQEQAVDIALRELDALREEARARAEVAGQRAGAIYRTQSTTTLPLATVLAAQTMDDAVSRSTYMEVVSRGDQGALEAYAASARAVENQRERLEAEEVVLAEVVEAQEEILAEARAIRDTQALAVADVDDLLGQLDATERHLESERRELAELIRIASRPPDRPSRGPDDEGGGGSDDADDSGSGGGSDEDTASEAPDSGGDEVVSSGALMWPASGTVTSEFGRRWGRMHEGIDIGAGTGSPVVAAASGRVAFAGAQGGFGNLVLVDHGNGLVTAYAHLSSISVSTGSSVGAGQQLGGIGCTGSCTGPHLHFEVRVNGSAQNPRNFLG